MKAFPATALALLPEMLARPLVRPIHFAFSYDEEVGCLGAPSMIVEIGNTLPRPSVVIIGEPTDMKVVSAHKGMWFFRTVVTGKEAHSSQTHRGVSAVMTGARLIAKLDEMARVRAAAADPDCTFAPPTTIHVGTIRAGRRPISSRDTVNSSATCAIYRRISRRISRQLRPGSRRRSCRKCTRSTRRQGLR